MLPLTRPGCQFKANLRHAFHPVRTARTFRSATSSSRRSWQTGPQATMTAATDLAFPPTDVALLSGSEPGSFAYDTISRRLPGILDGVIADLQQLPGAHQSRSVDQQQLQQQVNAAAQGVQQLRDEMIADGELPPLTPLGNNPTLDQIVGMTNHALDVWRSHYDAASNDVRFSWLGLPWLLVECYLYVRLQCLMRSQPLLGALSYDPFHNQKQVAFTKSMGSVMEIAAAVHVLINDQQQQQQQEEGLEGGTVAERLDHVVQYALWGNKSDLSLFTASSLDTAALAPGAARAAAAAAAGQSTDGGGGGGAGVVSPLLVDEFPMLWQYLLAKGTGSRMDIVLDNSGLELFTDLCLADFLVSSHLANKVVLHGKALPYFVSDTLMEDLEELVTICEADKPPKGVTEGGSWGSVRALGERWRGHLQSGRWEFRADPFWTTPYPFWWMPELAPKLYGELSSESQLVVFKGDLNYRKLAFDGRWSFTTPFPDALGPLKGFPLLSLRTLKADTLAGLKEGQAEAAAEVDKDWQVNGKFGVVQFAAPRT